MSKTKSVVKRIVGASLLFVLWGCSNSNAPPLTKAEEKEFKGGPMPAEARDIMAKKLAEANQKAPANTPGNVGPK